MKAITIPGANMVLAQDQDQYENLPVLCQVFTVKDDVWGDKTVPMMSSAWQPNEEDLRRLNDGGYIVLSILGTAHPPVLISTEDRPPAADEGDWEAFSMPHDPEK